MKVLSLNDHELTAKLEEHDEKKCDGWQLYAGYIIRQKIKKVTGTGKFDNAKI